MFPVIQSQSWFQLLTKSSFLDLEPVFQTPLQKKSLYATENETKYFDLIKLML